MIRFFALMCVGVCVYTPVLSQQTHQPISKKHAPKYKKRHPHRETHTKHTRQLDSFSYALGVKYAQRFARQNLSIHTKDFSAGLNDYLTKHSLAVDSAKLEEVIRTGLEKAKKRIVAKNKKAFADFLALNKVKPGVHEILPGLQYEVLKSATGPKPADSSTVVVHYVGQLLDGSVFDSSEQRNEPLTIRPDQVIRGWTQILKRMSKGAKWRAFIASDLAYGDAGAGLIPGGSGLIFTISLLDIR